MRFLVRKIVLIGLFILVLAGLIAIARGYRFNPSQRTIKSTGILVASSNPDGAKIFVNGELKGATNSNIIVSPGEYDVEIKKDGFTSWSKRLTIKGELVIKADALLFPQNPTLSPVTSLGVKKAFSSPTGDAIIIISESEEEVVVDPASDEEEKNGIYLLENVRNPLSRINPLNTLVFKSAFSEESEGFQLEDITIEFSPDEKQLLITTYIPLETDIEGNVEEVEQEDRTISNIYLIDAGSSTDDPFNVTESVDTIRNAWSEEQMEITEKALRAFKDPLADVALESFDIMAFSPDETRILYTATQSATLPLVIDPPLVATNQTPEVRDIETGSIYVYDAEEDRNYKVFGVDEFESLEDAKNRILWYPSSAHLILREDDKISAFDFDGTNKRTVYSGPFSKDFLATSKDGRLFILTNFNSETGSLQDLYSIGLK